MKEKRELLIYESEFQDGCFYLILTDYKNDDVCYNGLNNKEFLKKISELSTQYDLNIVLI